MREKKFHEENERARQERGSRGSATHPGIQERGSGGSATPRGTGEGLLKLCQHSEVQESLCEVEMSAFHRVFVGRAIRKQRTQRL